MLTAGMIIGIVAVVMILVMVVLFNTMIGKKNQVEFAFSSIDVQFKKRYDLIPNLINVCEKYMAHEKGLLTELTEIRSKAISASNDDQVQMEASISSQLRSVFAVAENYPDLKAIENFTLLQRSLNEVEDQLAASRRAFNAAVTDYNNACQMIPTNIVAGLMGYSVKKLLETPEEERKPVKVWAA